MTERFYDRTRRGGHWPSACENSQRCETARECKIEFFIVTGRDTAIATFAILNADCFPPAGGRTSDARPYNDGV
ncbi:MAG: hypothetical protein ACI3VK_03980, partial [Oscillospiraceae bacterium]